MPDIVTDFPDSIPTNIRLEALAHFCLLRADVTKMIPSTDGLEAIRLEEVEIQGEDWRLLPGVEFKDDRVCLIIHVVSSVGHLTHGQVHAYLSYTPEELLPIRRAQLMDNLHKKSVIEERIAFIEASIRELEGKDSTEGPSIWERLLE